MQAEGFLFGGSSVPNRSFALGSRAPPSASRYQASPRLYRGLDDLAYPFHDRVGLERYAIADDSDLRVAVERLVALTAVAVR